MVTVAQAKKKSKKPHSSKSPDFEGHKKLQTKYVKDKINELI